MSPSSQTSKELSVLDIYQHDIDISSSDPPMEEWSSLFSLPQIDCYKKALYNQGLYDPGSGEICTKYLSLSASSVYRHHYYAYPSIKDPGIKKALLDPEERKIYPLDGQELYLDLCEEMKLIPVQGFLRGLLEETIDLRYYGLNNLGVRAMSMALNYNQNVRRLDLTSNFLNEDACYHLGQMLGENTTLQELVLCGCRVKIEGIRRLVVNLATRSLDLLDLSRNEIGDMGFEHLAFQLNRGAVIKRLNLSYNGLTSASASLFASAIEGNNCITHLDLSWNKMSALKGVNSLLTQLTDSKVLVELNMAWNSVKLARILKQLITVRTLRILDLSNNRISKEGAKAIANGLHSAVSLHTLDLSYNPISPKDAFLILYQLRTKSIKLVNLLMDNVEVNREFKKERAEVLSLRFRSNCKITYGPVRHDYVLSTYDMREILLKRIDFLTGKGSKRHSLDIALYFLQKSKTQDNMQPRELMCDLKVAKTPVNEELIVGITDMFPGPKLEKGGKTIDLKSIKEMINRLWPDKKLPPTPTEPVLEPEVEKEGKKTGKEVKKKNEK